MKIPLCKTYIEDYEIEKVVEVLRSGWLAPGKYNTEFENNFAEYIGSDYALSLNSCTSALYLALISTNIKGEVIIPSFTFTATANAVVNAGAVPVFADVDEQTYNILPESIEKLITDKTEAVIPVHFAGLPCQMDKISNICRKHNLHLIEDSAETLGAEFNGKKTGSFGTGCFSFFPTKNMTTGEGGMLTTSNETIYNKVKALISHGILKSTFTREKQIYSWYRDASLPGHNFRLTNFQAVLGITQLKKLDKMNDMRREKSEYLSKKLIDIEEITTPFTAAGCTHSYQMYIIKLKDNICRDAAVLELNENGISASVHFYPPVHQQIYYKDKNFRSDTLENTVKLSKHLLTLPMYPEIKFEELDYIAAKLKEVIK